MVQPINAFSEDSPIQPEITEPLWTVDDVALYLRLNPETVRQMARLGRLPGIKVGRSWRFRPSLVKKGLDTQKALPSSFSSPVE